MLNKPSLRERLSNNAHQGARFVAEQGNGLGMSMSTAGGIGLIASCVGRGSDAESIRTLATTMNAASSGREVAGKSKLFASLVENVAPEWLEKKSLEHNGMTYLEAGPTPKMELQMSLQNLSHHAGMTFAKLAQGTFLEAAIPAKYLHSDLGKSKSFSGPALGI
ncbi:hypothetical protein ACI2KR_08230 [Pseudomonas luteola]